jgi:uncharacterized repeat protein (TIGR03806 family)
MFRVTLLGAVIAGIAALSLAPHQASSAPDKKAIDLDHRVPWATSKFTGSPEPPPPYHSETAFPKLKFFEPLDLTHIPGSNRLVVAERPGKIFSFVNDPKTEKPGLIIDVKHTTYAITFHPQFAKNGYLYVTWLVDPRNDMPEGTKIARYTCKGDPPVADPASEKIIFEWPSGGHNAGCLKFGPDGYLYVGCGDGSGIADKLETGQDISDVLASILRIDVDHPAGDKQYSIPKDNPFVETKGARGEVWAYGLRQPWKFSFDTKNGDLWCGEVGQDLWESVHKIEKGGNYGWSVVEGSHPFRPERKKGPTPILKPIVEHSHTDFRSLIGGYVYHGERLKDLQGAYIYGDFDTGRIWALRYDGKKVTYHEELARTPLRVVSFGTDSSGEIFHVDFAGGKIHRLAPTPKGSDTSASFPRKLSETGLFASTKDLTPADGLIPYSVNAELWSDGATKQRYLAIPGDGQIDFNAIEYPQPSPGAPRGWRFPDGTVVVKTFFLEMEKGNPASRRRLETRILHFQQFEGTEEYGDQYWHGYTYIWNDDQTEAELADASGVDRKFTITDKSAPSGKREQAWHFPSRAECTLCHTMPAKYALGLNALQMNKDYDYGGGNVVNQLTAFERMGMFKKPLPDVPQMFRHLVDYNDTKQSVEDRARSYLHANCAHCHMKWGGGNAEFRLLATLTLDEMGIVNTKPGQGTFDLKDPRILVPGDPDRSLMLHRMTITGLGRMPHVASSVVDEKGVALIRQWIKEMPKKD